MVVSDPEDSLTQINTALNRSMVLMEDNFKASSKEKEKSRKSITINPVTIQAASTPIQKQKTIRKSILKKPEKDKKDERESLSFREPWQEENNVEHTTTKFVSRPHNLEEFMETEDLILDPTEQTYTLKDVDVDDELWIIQVPKSVNPHELRGQVLYLGEKTKLKLGEEKYQAVFHQTSDCLTCVFGTGKEEKPYKIVNIRPSGSVTLRRRLTSASTKINSANEVIENSTVPFPKGLKQRDPLVGVSDSGKIKKKLKHRLKKSRDSVE